MTTREIELLKGLLDKRDTLEFMISRKTKTAQTQSGVWMNAVNQSKLNLLNRKINLLTANREVPEELSTRLYPKEV